MSEISSPKYLSTPDIKIDRTANNQAGINRVLTGKETIKESLPEKEHPVFYKSSDVFTSESVPKNIFQTSQSQQFSKNSLLLDLHLKTVDQFVKIQERVDRNKQVFIDISDKLAAIYGEKEKDIKDKLSDVFKKLILTPFNLISEVETSMSQHQHNKEKQLKDNELGKQNSKIGIKNKIFSIKQWINNKLLEIAGEILNISKKFAAGIKQKQKSLKTGIYKGFKKIKENFIFSLDKIESLFEAGKDK